MKPKVLVLTTTFPRWKNDIDPPFVYELSKRLAASFEVHVLTPHYPGAKYKEMLGGISVRRFPYFIAPCEKLAGSVGILPTLQRNKFYYLLIPFFLIAQLIFSVIAVRKIRPDVIHAHWIIPQGVVASILQKIFGVPVIVTAHGADVFGLQGKFFRKLKQAALKSACQITVVSKALACQVKSIDSNLPEPIVLPMGVDASLFSLEHASQSIRKKYTIRGPFLLFVGRLTEKKGVIFLIDAMVEVIRLFPDAKLLIIGSGELAPLLQEHAIHLNLSRHVVFLGGISNHILPQYYASADVFIGPSIQIKKGDTEGFGLTFVEAALSGCLVIGTKVGGVEDIVADGKTGFLVQQRNATALAQKLIWMLEHLADLDDVKEKARERCRERFDWEVVSAKYLALFNECINAEKQD
ncbi:glycosyltransferase [Desulfogranum marinum]|uniref:glycosyltransferase n=1 Tax=Desulfogranum marinum TaxID=453220 RepID=UPI0019666B43|nr:glycosyltransferase [Desulfogranum marinum]MBM9513271.1 glycosyltransferase [Desulfogranum marinum]